MLLNSFSLGLNRGIYSLSLNYQNDTEDEIAFRVLDMEKNDGNNHLGKVINEGLLKTGEREDALTFELAEDSNNIQLEFAKEVKINSWKVDLEKDYYTDNVFLFLLLAGTSYVICFRVNWKKPQYAVLMMAVGVFVTLPFAGEMVGFTSGHDIAFHLSRIQGVAEGLRNGQIPVRLNMDMNQGYGFVSEMLYPNLFVYPPAILMALGMSLMAAYKYWILILYEDSGKWKVLAAGTFGVLHSHVLTFQLCVLLGLIFCLVSWRQFFSEGFFRKLIAGGKRLYRLLD